MHDLKSPALPAVSARRRSLGAALALVACGACASQPAGQPTLVPVAGAVVTGRLAPGEVDVFPLELEAGLYLETYLDRPEAEALVYLLPPGTPPEAGKPAAYTWGEFEDDPPGQVMWEVMVTPGLYHLGVEALDRPVAYRLAVCLLLTVCALVHGYLRCRPAENDAV